MRCCGWSCRTAAGSRWAQGSLPSSPSLKAAAVLACRSAIILATSCQGSPINPYRRWLGLHPRPIPPGKQNNLLPLLSQRQLCTRPVGYPPRGELSNSLLRRVHPIRSGQAEPDSSCSANRHNSLNGLKIHGPLKYSVSAACSGVFRLNTH
jgi:hypothetical protein